MSDPPNDIEGLDLPIALRRAKRRSEAISPAKPSTSSATGRDVQLITPITPSRARGKKRVRFSDSSLATSTMSTASSGLTPHVGRVSLRTPRRRASTPASPPTNPVEIQFTPFRQVLEDRAKRRIRRNGLSKEMNDYECDRKDRVQLAKELYDKDQELQKLKDDLEAARQACADDANHQTVQELSSSQRLMEEELTNLRQSFDQASIPNAFDDEMDMNWDAVNVHKATDSPGPLSDIGNTMPIYVDNADAFEPHTSTTDGHNTIAAPAIDTAADEELLAVALDLEAAKQERRQLFRDVRSHVPSSQRSSSGPSTAPPDIQFQDSPARLRQNMQRHPFSLTTSMTSLPSPPKTFYADISKALKANIDRAECAELALRALESDLRTLGFNSPFSEASSTSAATILENIRTHFRQARMDLERVLPGETVSGLSEPAQVVPEAIAKLKLLSRRVHDHEAELRSMHEQQRTLKGNFHSSLDAAAKANQRIKELEDAIEESADDMLHLRSKMQTLEKDGVEKDHTITSLISALDKYRADVARLEGLVVQLEHERSFKVQEAYDENDNKISDLEAKVAAEETGRRKAEDSAVERLEKIKELQKVVDTANDDASSFQIQLSALEAEKAEAEAALRKSRHLEQKHEPALAYLNTRIANLSTALSGANAENDRLQGLVAKLQARLQTNDEVDERAVQTIYEENIRALTKIAEVRKSFVRGKTVRRANWELEDEAADHEDGEPASGPMTPVSLVRFVDVEHNHHHTQPDDATVIDHGEEEVDDNIPANVQICRGGSSGHRRARAPRGLNIAIGDRIKRGAGKGPRGKRLDSAIGMMSSCLSEVGEDDESEMVLPSSEVVTPTSLGSEEDDAVVGFQIHVDAADVPLPSSELGGT